jgi:hypothetical protein
LAELVFLSQSVASKRRTPVQYREELKAKIIKFEENALED